MYKLFCLFVILLVYSGAFAQTKFMAGVSVSPDVTLSPDVNYKHYYPAFSTGAGANFGMYFGKRLFLLTGIEVIGISYFSQGSYPIPPASVYNYKNTTIANAWDVPVLFNYMVTNKTKKVSFFVTAGLSDGRYISIKNDQVVNGVDYKSTEKGKEIKRSYGGLIAGLGCKVNLNEKYSLLIMPDYNYSDGFLFGKLVEVRTMLMCNF